MKFLWQSGCTFVLAGILFGVLHAQRPYRLYPSVEGYDQMPLPPDWKRPAEWTFARLMYPPGPLDGYCRTLRRRLAGGPFALDPGLSSRRPSISRQAVRRLTRIHVRSVEQPVNLDDGDEVYNWPWLYAVQVGEWGLTDAQAKKLRDYLLRGGFFMADDFHGTEEWRCSRRRMSWSFRIARSWRSR